MTERGSHDTPPDGLIRKVVVTGAGSGIGAATVSRFKSTGTMVAAIDNAEPNRDADLSITADISREEDVAESFQTIAKEFGGIDVLVASAGVSARGTVMSTPSTLWDQIFAVNVRGVFLCARAAIPHMLDHPGSSIVVVGSQLGLVARSEAAAYCSSKAAVIQLTRAMAIDHAADGIRVNCICPGPTDTPMLARRLAGADEPKEERAAIAGELLTGRFATAEEIANGIFYLAAPESASTVGATLVIDGGYTIH